ncbi:SulP family inorganic anion transporter [Flavisphingomonas formosensis]|uniref:SulP family inorganic anion transporter n=1 Tax=Flavisphingomonas formosensis TaxID=861534 RepID=UPI0012F877B3|nr:SulP family inorganic anion transporter [Sphingomonas formosensis]
MRKGDVIAGISVAGLMLPEAVAYAGIAGLPPQRAISAAIAGSLTYALIGRSRFAIVSPTSSSAAILAASLGMVSGNPAMQAALATIAVVLVGLAFLSASAAHLGGLTGFVSRPVLRGFAFGLAITIILKQLPILVGVPLHASDIFHLVGALTLSLPRWHLASVATGLVALAALLLLRRIPTCPAAFLVLAAGIAGSFALDLPERGVAVVGKVDLVPGWPQLPAFTMLEMQRLAELIVPLVLILFAESWGTMRAMALRHGDTIEPNRELAALGAANLAAGALQGMPVGAGFSAGSASESAGAVTRQTGIVAALGLALLMLLGSGLVAHLPEPVLAAVVIAALTHALDPAPLVRLWHLGRDPLIALGAAAGVLVLGVLNGMLFAILLSLAALIRRISTPTVVRLGRLGDGHDYVDIARHPEAMQPSGLMIWRPAVPLFFANAEHIFALIAAFQAAEPATHTVIVSLEESFDLDSTALDALMEFDATLRTRSTTLHLARVRDGIRDLLHSAGGDDLVRRSSYSVDDAVMSARADASR